MPSIVTVTHNPSRSGNKRSATDAFSPTSTSFPPIKQAKCPTGLSLDIPERQQGPPSGHSISPSEPLQSFSKLSLDTSPNVIGPIAVLRTSPTWPSTQNQGPPRTLTSEYRVDEQRTAVAPQNLYHYSLACSPTEEDNRTRKARIWCRQPPPVTSAEYGYAAQAPLPMVVHSACASPHEIHGYLRPGVPTLPHFSEPAWDRRGAPAPVVQGYQVYHQQSDISSAPFANGGPPGVQFQFDDNYAHSSPLYNRM
ncbi:hypothetical protein BDY19DRAFT_998686 [Irpex rosettiformis]|uniref:Uncharacterized protein n=1 Tax=Irpex rosettiformis TaxID=378272 RepID=A0ACB8TMQ1_9APHY|nr:hypothetical protein BDY19DRAFT_998686 [Irpex rosettiformis]